MAFSCARLSLAASMAQLALTLILALVGLVLVRQTWTGLDRGGRRVTVVVVGDIGRSPRMQYHALSLARHGYTVQLVGYKESAPDSAITASSNIKIYPLPTLPAFLRSPNRLLLPLKLLFLTAGLWAALCWQTKPPSWIVVQNPPSIPTIPLALLAAAQARARLVVDWHNYGFTILALRPNPFRPFVWLYQKLELGFGSLAHHHLAVTDLLAQDILDRTGTVRPLTLHDRPFGHYQPLSADEKAAFLGRCPITADVSDELITGERCLVVSSTSWTPDEDFSVLLDALVIYNQGMQTPGKTVPKLLVVITGKGPQKAHYLSRIQQLAADGQLPDPDQPASAIMIRTGWLPSDDYAGLLGAGSVGVSLHKSSSGLDFPMKVVDMFGAGLAVFGWSRDFPAWAEVVAEGRTGHGFGSAAELAGLMAEVLPDQARLVRLSAEVRVWAHRRWDDEWDSVFGSLLERVSASKGD